MTVMITVTEAPQDLKLVLDDGYPGTSFDSWSVQNVDPRQAVFLSDTAAAPAAGSTDGLYIEPGQTCRILPGGDPLWAWTLDGIATVAASNSIVIEF